MQLLTIEAHWRQDEQPGPMHQYFTGFDVLSADEIEEVFPENDVPDGLHFEDVDEQDSPDSFSEHQFTEWLSEGRHDCDVAQTLLHAWTRFMNGTGNDALSDFFHDLLREAHAAGVASADDEGTAHSLPLSFLAHFIRERCVLPFHVSGTHTQDIEAELDQRIVEEFRAIHAYVRTWQSSGAYPVESVQTVQEELEGRVSSAIYPWPTIDQHPVPERADGRLVKSHPLEFPMGQGDFRQPRLSATFSAFDYVQHKFRYFDGRFLSTLRGQRVTWALFNIALRESGQYVGSLVHKQSGQAALTKQELRDLLAAREDLVRRVAAFGADIPTTPMYWKRHGNELEWIVRQMSWQPCWCAPNDKSQKPYVGKVFFTRPSSTTMLNPVLHKRRWLRR